MEHKINLFGYVLTLMISKKKNINWCDTDISDFFHYGMDHFETAMFLFDHSLLRSKEEKLICNTLDSAAYLACLGLELILKGCML